MADIDDKITELFNIVRTQRAELEETERESKSSWKTNCTIHLEPNSQPINIQTALEDTIKRVVASLLRYEEYFNRAEKLLGLSETKKFDGYAYEDWYTDCKKRIAVIGLRAKKDKLAAMEQRLDAIVSPEQRRQMELDAITKSLSE